MANAVKTPTGAYRWFPHGLFAAMAVVFAVNGYMVYTAVSSFPGEAGTDGFDLSNNYDKVIHSAEKQAQLGWQAEVRLDSGAHPVLRLADHAGAPLTAASIDAKAERPLGPPETTVLTFAPNAAGAYAADAVLSSGQWDLLLTIHRGGETFSTTQRLIVK